MENSEVGFDKKIQQMIEKTTDFFTNFYDKLKKGFNDLVKCYPYFFYFS